MFRGSIPALVTPFRGESFDEEAYRAFVEWQISQGSHGLVPCGTTGETATLSFEEHFRVVEVCVDQAAGRVPVMAGCGSNNTIEAKLLLKAAEERGADAALVVLPYYNRPNQEGLYAHFAALAEATRLPIYIYNVPSRTVTNIQVETLARLSKFANIVGIKDATGDLARVSAQRLACGEDFIQLSGNDDVALGFMAMGGSGAVSVTANVAPRLCSEFQNACMSGDWEGARRLQDRLFPLHEALFSDASPGPVKYALSRVRPEMPSGLRLPMTPAGEESRRQVDAALAHAGLV